MKLFLNKKIGASLMLTIVAFVSFFAPFSIQPESVSPTTLTARAQQLPPPPEPIEGDELTSKGLPACHPLNGYGPGDGTLMGCVAVLAYYVLFVPSSVVAFLGASFLDFFLDFSLSDTSYRNPFVEVGWKLIRDISNIFFILVLLYVAIAGMFNSGPGFQKSIFNIIIAALLINFSLFFTRVVIDVSNITSRVFYNSIEVTQEGTDDAANIFGTKSVSTAIASSINPQKIIGGIDLVGSGSTAVETTPGSTAKPLDASSQASFFLIIALMATAVSIVMAWVFFTSSFLFLGRVIGLYFAMILSPFAIMSRIYAPLSGLDYVGWKGWVSNLTQLAILGPLFTFFLYLISLFSTFTTQVIGKMTTQGDLANTVYAQGVGSGSNSFFSLLFSVVMPMAMITGMLIMAQKVAKKHAGTIGGMAVGAMEKVGGIATGVALGVATGGASFAMRKTVGAAAARGAADTDLQRRAAEGDKDAQRKLDRYNNLASRSFDLRNTDIAKLATGKGSFMKDLDKRFLKSTGLAQESGVGGVKKVNEEKTKKALEDASKYSLSGRAASEQDKKAKEWKEQYEKDLEEARKAGGVNFNQSAFKEAYENGKNTHTNTDVAKKVQDSKEINSKLLNDKANDLEYGKEYNKKRDEAREQARQAGQKFDEKQWKNTWLAQNPPSNLSVADQETVASMRKKAGEEGAKPVSKKERAKMENQLNQANQKIQGIQDLLEMVSNTELGDKDAYKNLSQQEIQQHINSALQKLDDQTITHDSDILLQQQRMAAASGALSSAQPGSREYQKHQDEMNQASAAIINAQREKKAKEEQIKNLKNLWRDQLDATTRRDEAEERIG